METVKTVHLLQNLGAIPKLIRDLSQNIPISITPDISGQAVSTVFIYPKDIGCLHQTHVNIDKNILYDKTSNI